MVIDIHSHLLPVDPSGLGQRNPALMDVDRFLHQKDAEGITVTVISNAMLFHPGAPVDPRSLDEVRRWKEFARQLRADHPERIEALLGINAFAGPEMLDEARRAVAEDGFKGVLVHSSNDGEYLDSERVSDFWAMMSELDAPVFIHPPFAPLGAPAIRDRRLLEYGARAVDVALSLAALICAGVLERHGNLKLICAGGAGGLAAWVARLDAGYESRSGPPSPGSATAAPAKAAISRPPSWYLRNNVYVDSLSHGIPQLLLNANVFGADRILLGTDNPPVPVPATATLALVGELPILEHDREGILWRNASELFDLERPAAG